MAADGPAVLATTFHLVHWADATLAGQSKYEGINYRTELVSSLSHRWPRETRSELRYARSIVSALADNRFTERNRNVPYRVRSSFASLNNGVGQVSKTTPTPKPHSFEWGSSSLRRAEITDLR